MISGGVDVSECQHCGSQKNCMIYGHLNCAKFPDCYFKQLARKTQECEKYEQALDEIKKQAKINCEEICGKNYDTCKDRDCLTIQIKAIINKAKEGK